MDQRPPPVLMNKSLDELEDILKLEEKARIRIRKASCSCGETQIECEGDPVRVAVCHCNACQKRTGSVFGAQARYYRAKVRIKEGKTTEYIRKGDMGDAIHYRFCSTCGSTVYYEASGVPQMKNFIMIPVGVFADKNFPSPSLSVYDDRAHSWSKIDIEGCLHFD
mmetsp:Transcript_4051/g.5817  ORF Transcript_4051/g.5817 Transcript_4051/m.5817 type:complete len:165 (-) Transcript_4051:310-804(-)|eukprot:CAMPEP_0184481990 /NCGR_PEP_ID=MMETSP0113_2-20130426/3576_1 /TAXON_ID=91329 /ORGANISM="Norrisiella sphaerica, Strain BC52" /LENGTH=164 /DNA_ID=CAMNT_0026861489 /DNA_START=153 /DNA_END=647 /DNA_ORIENTATION=-